MPRLLPVDERVVTTVQRLVAAQPTLPSTSCFKWLFYISPTYYGFSSLMRLLLPNIEFECDFDSVIECYQFSGIYILYDGGLVDIKPYKSLLILNVFTVVALLLAGILERGAFRAKKLLSFMKCENGDSDEENEGVREEDRSGKVESSATETEQEEEGPCSQMTGSQNRGGVSNSEALEKRRKLFRRNATLAILVPSRQHCVFKRCTSRVEMERRMAQDAKRLQLQREQTLTDFTQMVKQLESDDPDDGVMENDSLVRKWTLEESEQPLEQPRPHKIAMFGGTPGTCEPFSHLCISKAVINLVID